MFINYFKGSDDEKRDLKKGYLAGKGDMDFIINMVPFSSVYEEDRLREALTQIIEEEDLPRYEEFTNEHPLKKKKRLAKVSIIKPKIIQIYHLSLIFIITIFLFIIYIDKYLILG